MSEPGKPPDFGNLSENLSQQQAKITALKELVRQSESQQGRNTASAQEKVKNIAQRLSNLKAKATKTRHQRSSSEVSDYEFSNIEEEEMQQQTPETSMRTRSETPGSEKITMLRKQMELNRMKMAERESRSKEIEQMVTQLKSKFETSQMSLEKSVELGRSVGDLSSSSLLHPQHRSSTVSDVSHSKSALNFDHERIRFLEKRINELENNFSESDKVQELERKILDLEENLKEKESIIDARTKAVSLLSDNLTKKKKDVVDSLEETKQEMFKMQEVFLDAESSYKVEVDRLNRIIKEKSNETENLNEKVEILEKSRYELTIENSDLKTKLEDVKDYSTKITELKMINETLQKQIANLESQRYEFIDKEDVDETKRESSDENDEKIKQYLEQIEQLQENLQEKTVELNVVNANLSVLQEKLNSKSSKSPFDMDDEDETQVEVTKLKQQIDEANKAAIKDKLKIKQLQKQVDSAKKGDANKEVARLTDEVQRLSQTIAELEEKNKTEGWDDSWGENTDFEQKIQTLETTIKNQNDSIILLEQQKLELSEKIQNSSSDEKLKELEERINELLDEKKILDEKLTRYSSHNSELLDKIEKLSKGSSAESIEMVNLTAQESEEYRKTLSESGSGVEISEELNESLKNLREESSELMSKIELFTIERREVLDKLDAVIIENQVLVSSIETLRSEKVDLEHENECLKENIVRNENIISELQNEKQDLSTKVSDLSDHRTKLQDEINKLVKESLEAASSQQGSPSKSTEDAAESSSINKEACEKLLQQLESDIQTLNKNKDRNKTNKISKKLSDNAKNVHAMMTNLLIDYYKNLEECQQLKEDLEKVKIYLKSVTTNDDEVKEMKEKLIEKSKEFDDLKMKFCELSDSHTSETKDEMENLKVKLDTLSEALKEKDENSEKLQDLVDNLTMERDRCESEIQNQKQLADELRGDFDKLCVDVKVNNQKLHEKSTELEQLRRDFDMRLKTSTNEVDILKTLVAEQKQLLIDSYQEHELDINQKVEELNNYREQVEEMEKELNSLRERNDGSHKSYVNELQQEIEKLKKILQDTEKTLEEHREELLHKQATIDTLNGQIIDLYKTMEENANRIIEKEDEIQYLQEINDTNREEIRKLHQKLDESTKTVEGLRTQLDDEKSTPRAPSSDDRVKQLESEVQKLETKNKENVEKLKKFAANLKKKQSQITELESKIASQNVPDSNLVEELRSQISAYEEKMQAEEAKFDEMEKNIFDYEVKLRELESERKNLKDSKNQLEKNLFDYETRIQELEEPVNRMREMSNEFEKLKKENEELKEKSTNVEKSEEVKKFDKLKATAVKLKHQLNEKKKEVEELTAQLESLKSPQPTPNLDELKNSYEHQLAELRNEIDSSKRMINEDNQRKLSLEAQLETFESSSLQFQERIALLEETIDTMENDRNSLQREKLSLVAELEEKVNDFACSEEDFARRLNSLLEQDQIIGQKLRETQDDNFQLCESVKELTTERDSLAQKLTHLEAQLNNSTTNNSQKIADIESENSTLQQQLQHLQNEIKKMQVSHEQLIAAKHAEIDDMEADLSSQLQRIEAEKKIIQEALEKANDQIVDFQDEVVRLKDTTHSLEQARADIEREMSWLKLQSENYTQDQLEIEQLRMQLMQSETEAENLRSQNENLQENHNVEIMILRQQISDLETMRSQVSQNQTDDQVMLENENIRLKELLTEKENELTQRNIQLQMTSTFFETPMQAVNDPFANLETIQSPPPPTTTTTTVVDNSQEIEKLKESLTVVNMELDMQTNRVQELLHENQRMTDKLHEMQSLMDNLIKTNVELEASLETKDSEINEIKSELKNLRENLNRSTDDEKTHVLETEFDNIQGIVQRFDDNAASVVPTTSMFFSDDPQPGASSLFDPFVIPPQPQQEVIEEIIQPKSAYLCYDQKSSAETQTDDVPSNEIYELQVQIHNLQINIQEQSTYIQTQTQHIQMYAERVAALESELEVSRNMQRTQEMEIQQLHQRPAPAVEPAAIQQYFEVPQQVLVPQLPALDLGEDDGWGWSGNESSSQEPATVPQSLLSPRSEIEVRLQEQRDIVERLEREKSALNEELANVKENGKKMMKKLKEYQTKIKEIETKSLKPSSSFDSDMDQVIQDELNSQIQKLESKLKEVNGERQKEHEERENLVKKVEVLSSANERMIEMKERQDSQMELYQLKIRDMNQKLLNLESWGDESDKKESEVSSSPAKENQSEKIAELSAQIKDLQVDLDEAQALLEEEKINNKRLEDKISKMTDSNDSSEQLKLEIENLSSEREKLMKEVSVKNDQIQELVSKIDLLSNESSNIRSILEDLSSQIQQKTNENQELHEKLEGFARNNEELSRERQFVNDSMETNFRSQADELEQQLQQLNAELQYKNSQIEEFKATMLKESTEKKSLIETTNAKDQELMELRSRLSQLENQPATEPLTDTQQRLQELEKSYKELLDEKSQMEHELQVLNDQVLMSLEFEDKMKNTVLELDAKNIEIQMLKTSLEKLQDNSNKSAEMDLLNAKWSQAVEQRGNEVANSWKQHLEMKEAEFAQIESQLRKQLEQKSSQNVTDSPQTSDDSEMMTKMQTILETQEVEIVSLKEQLAIRSAEYAALSAKVDPYRQLNVSSILPQADADRVPRSELDLALYMLHQRDMRLEEMTLELVRLLEERDQLQLRLSNSIRQSEEIRRKFNVQEGESSDNSNTATPEKSPPTNVADDQLRAKLTELNTVRHSRDKVIIDEREQRFIDSISMMQRDVEHLPNEAAARIVGSSSDASQSPSSVLMNWIMGSKSDSS